MDFVAAQLGTFSTSLIGLAADPITYAYLVPAVFLGIVFGALPGLTATLAVTILTGFFGNKFPLDQALIALIGAYVGAIYGGSYPSILLNIPGTAASAATAMDGYPLTQAGPGGQALGLTTTASFIDTLFGTGCLLIFVWVLLLISQNIASPEKALLALFGILLAGTLMSKDLVIKGGSPGSSASTPSCPRVATPSAGPTFSQAFRCCRCSWALLPFLKCWGACATPFW